MDVDRNDDIQLNGLLNALTGITQRILNEQPMPDIVEYLCKELVKTMDYPLVYLALIENNGSTKIAAQCGLTEDEIDYFQFPWDAPEHGKRDFVRTINTGRVQVSDLRDASYTGSQKLIFKKHSLRSAAFFPISLNNKVAGILAVYSKEQEFFNATRIEQLKPFKDQLALVLLVDEDRHKLNLQTEALIANIHAIVILDAAGKIVWANPAFTKLTGYNFKNILGQTLGVLRSGYQDKNFYKKMWETVLSGHIWQGELINQRADGTLYTEEMTITPIKAKRQEKTYFIAVKKDISKRVENQKALEEREEQFRDMFETMKSAVVVFKLSEDGQDFICTDINRAAEKVENITRSQAIGASLTHVFPLIKELGILKLCFQVYHTGERVRFPAVYFNNYRATGWSEGVIYKLSTGSIVFLYDEVSQRVLSEKELWQEKERAQVTLASIGDAVLTTDVHGNVTYLNPVAERISGWKNEEAQGLRIESVFDIFDETNGQPMDQPVLKCLQEDRVVELSNHAVLRHRDGRRLFHIDDSAAPIRDRDGRVIGAVLVFHDVSEKRELMHRLSYQANHDALTDLPNRQLFEERVQKAIIQAQNQQIQVAILFIDLDGFKLVNDTLGHAAGDSLLCQVGDRFGNALRQEDTVARQGGDEFLVLLPKLSSKQDAAHVAQKLINALNSPFHLHNEEVYLTASVGITVYPRDGEDSETLIQRADMAMYQVKAEGRNNYQFYTSVLNERLAERLALQNEMRRALERNEFILHYQPQYRLSDGKLCGMEALVRWLHPKRGLILPGSFISLAEESGLILPLGEWVLRSACAQNKLWQDMGYQPVRVAVNLSARQFRQNNLVEHISAILDETGLDPKWLVLEITESLSMENVVASVEILQKLRNMGIHLSIDDFGTGFSSLSHLSCFSLNTLKIDRSFISMLGKGLEGQAIVVTIIQLAKNLGLSVIAEGVETQLQLDFLRTRGCDEVQGFLLAKPGLAEEMVNFFSKEFSL